MISFGYENNSFDEFYVILYNFFNWVNSIIEVLEVFESDQEAC